MKADHIRHLYQYHFAMNRKVWDEAVSQLSEDQFTHQLPGTGTSVRSQIVHLIGVDREWFRVLQGTEWTGTSNPAAFPDRESVRAYWDQTEAMMKEYLNQIDDKILRQQFPPAPVAMQIWQILLHVVAHGIDHRAHLFELLNRFGVETFEQDYALYLFGGSWPEAAGEKWVLPEQPS